MKSKRRMLVIAMSMTVALSLIIVGFALAEITAHVLIDDFTDVGPALSILIPAGGTDVDSDSATGTMLGGERDMVITSTGSLFSTASFRVFELLRLSQESSVVSIAKIQWDGTADSGASTVDTDGLGGVDLTDGGADDGFHVEIVNDDIPLTLTVRVYSDTSSAGYSILLPGSIDTGQGDHVDFFIPFNVAGLSGFDFTDVGAIEVEFDTSLNAGADIDIEFFEADDFHDYGDLPLSYGVPISNANHIPHGLRLGRSVDIEENSQPSALANGDEAVGPTARDVDDEDGVIPTPTSFWNVGIGGGSVDVTVNGCSGTCYLNGWINWNSVGVGSDSDFADPGEQVFTNTAVMNGTQSFTFNIPAGADTTDTNFFARFRICENSMGAGSCNSLTGEVFNGEVEDHYWSFGPTAITLSDLTARSASRVALPLVGASLILLVGLLLYARQARRRSL